MVFIGRIVEREAPPDEWSGGAGSGEGAGQAGPVGALGVVGGGRARGRVVRLAMPVVEGVMSSGLPA